MSSSERQKQCPYCAELISDEAVKCRYCGSWLDRSDYLRTWTRSRTHAKVWGICAGLARQFGIQVTFIRLAFIILTFIGGWGILFYLALWFLMPLEDE
ncbi:PspC domain-containing protein [bacterium]|nr:PspC domain-containing protein [bacterium]